MSQSKNRQRRRTDIAAVAAKTADWAPLPAMLTDGAAGRPASDLPSQIADAGQVRLGGQSPMFLADAIEDGGRVRLGGQAPMFLPDAIEDGGLVRLGGQSPIF